MKLWDTLTTCMFLLSIVHANPLFRSRRQSTSRRVRAASAERFRDSRTETERLSVQSTQANMETNDREEMSETKEFNMADPHLDQFEDVVDFIRVTISRIRRSSSQEVGSGARQRRERRKGGEPGGGGGVRQKLKGGKKGGGSGGRRRGGGGQGCVLKQIRLNVSDLGLGYQTSEEMIFKYCSGPCHNSETNYDKILNNLSHSRRLSLDTPPHTCCRPTAFDDDLSFLDDNLIYHTMKKHSARKCGCV